MSEWKEVNLRYYIKTNKKSIGKDYTFNKIEYLDTGSITCNKIDELKTFTLAEAPSRARRLVEQDDIIYSTVRPNQLHYGYINKPIENLVVSTGFVTISANKKYIYPKFLYYYLIQENMTEYLHSIAEASTSTYPSLKPTDIESLEITLPPLLEQRAIASVLSCLDDKIDLLHRQNATLERMAETLFRQWFVEPFQKIEYEGGAVERFQLGKFSKWIEGTVGGEWGKENSQGEFTKEVYCIRGTDIADLNSGLPLKTPRRFVKENKFEKIKPSDGDLIIEISGGTESQSTGRITYINTNIENLFDLPLIFSNFCRMIKVKKPEYSFFIYCYLQYLYNQDEFFNIENGSSGIKNLDYKALLFELDYPMPDEELVLQFYKAVQLFFKKINENKSQIQALTKLRDTLLPKLMSGEIRIE